jgi:hypothetical protein
MRDDYVLKHQPNKKAWDEIDPGMREVWLLHADSAISALSRLSPHDAVNERLLAALKNAPRPERFVIGDDADAITYADWFFKDRAPAIAAAESAAGMPADANANTKELK